MLPSLFSMFNLSFRRQFSLVFLILSFNYVSVAQQKVAFYFGAHQDDWQLFMNPNAYYDVRNNSAKVVFVYLTAGDAGAGIGNGGGTQPYYLARENGAKLSVKFMVDSGRTTLSPVTTSASYAGHPVTKWVYGNTVSYFLRLPDGNVGGIGYATTGQQSLKRLRDKNSPMLMAVDSSTSYQSWEDLKTTLKALIDHERGNAPDVWVHCTDTDTTKNVGDHEDHLHTAKAVMDAVAGMNCINKIHYLDYVTSKMPENITPAERDIEAATFGVLTAGLTELGHRSSWDALHRSWLGRQYFRIERSTGSCR